MPNRALRMITMKTVRPSGICRSVLLTLLTGGAIALMAGQGPATPPAAAQAPAEWSERAKSFGELEWITRPSRDAVMSFTIPVEIREIVAKPGQRVKQGDLLIRARDGDALAAVEVQRVRAGNTGPIGNARAAVDSADTRYKRILEADKDKATNQQEVDDRRVQLDAARSQLANAENEHREEEAKLKQLIEQAARYRLDAPFDGVIESVIVEAGSSIEPPNPVLRIVNIDTLWIDLPTPTEITLSKNLKAGDKAWVLLDVPGGWMSEGKIVYVSPIADAAAATRRVRIEVVNSRGLPPGTRARVRFDKPEGFLAGGQRQVDEPAAQRGGSADAGVKK